MIKTAITIVAVPSVMPKQLEFTWIHKFNFRIEYDKYLYIWILYINKAQSGLRRLFSNCSFVCCSPAIFLLNCTFFMCSWAMLFKCIFWLSRTKIVLDQGQSRWNEHHLDHAPWLICTPLLHPVNDELVFSLRISASSNSKEIEMKDLLQEGDQRLFRHV